VFAGDIRPSEPEPNIVPFFLDVTSQESVDAALKHVSDTIDENSGLQGLVHFAGILRVGPLIDMNTLTLSNIFDVNFLGVHRVTRTFFPLIRAGKGRILVISSEVAIQTTVPFNAPYGTSKKAIDAYADALRRELAFLGVMVVKIRPGPFKTDMLSGMVGEFEKAAEGSPTFAPIIKGMIPTLKNEQAKGLDPEFLAGVVEEALTVSSPKISYNVKPDRGRMLVEWLPTSWADWIMHRAVMWLTNNPKL
jgi:NAD(P)-dependent dehydrogenase (short-subunit alcohol dehydrogenase family)